MQEILQTIDEVLALCEHRRSEMTDRQAAEAIRQAMVLIRDSRAILEQHKAVADRRRCTIQSAQTRNRTRAMIDRDGRTRRWTIAGRF